MSVCDKDCLHCTFDDCNIQKDENARYKAYYAENRARELERHRIWEIENVQRRKQYFKDYYQKNKAKKNKAASDRWKRLKEKREQQLVDA